MFRDPPSRIRREAGFPLALLALLCTTVLFTSACNASETGEAETSRSAIGQAEATSLGEALDREAQDREALDGEPHSEHDEEAEAIREALGIEPGETVADVGAGDGDWTGDLARFVGEDGAVWATEVDEDLVAELREMSAEESLPQVRVVRGDQESTGLPENCCDAALLRLVYHHFTDPAVMRADLRRALKPGGRLLVVEILPQEGWRELGGVPERGGHGIAMERLIEEMEVDGFRAVERLVEWGDEVDEYAVVFVPVEP